MDSEIPSIVATVARALRIRASGKFAYRSSAVPRRVLVAPHLRLGDAILVTPLLAKLRERYPDCEIVLLSHVSMATLYGGRPFGVQVWPYHPRRTSTLTRMFHNDGFDLAIIPGDNRNAWLAAALRARWIVAHSGDRPRIKNWFVDEAVPYPEGPKALGDIFADLIPGPPPRPFRCDDWPAPTCEPFHAPPQPYCVLHVAATNPLRNWRPENWRHLAEWLDRRSLQPVWSAGPGQRDVVRQIDPAGHYPSYAEQLDLAQVWHLIKNAELCISVDTGIAHLARLTGRPTVTLFGPGSAVLFGRGSYWSRLPCAEITVKDFSCRDQCVIFNRQRDWIRHCSRSPRQCRSASCMDAISPEDVDREAAQLLAMSARSFRPG